MKVELNRYSCYSQDQSVTKTDITKYPTLKSFSDVVKPVSFHHKKSLSFLVLFCVCTFSNSAKVTFLNFQEYDLEK